MAFKILIVDDDAAVRDVLARFLRRRGYDVQLAENGHDALQVVRAAKPDLMLLDICLPTLSGLDVLDQIQVDQVRGEAIRTRTIALSGVADKATVQDSLRLGAVAFVPKPFNFPDLTAEINTNLIAGLAA